MLPRSGMQCSCGEGMWLGKNRGRSGAWQSYSYALISFHCGLTLRVARGGLQQYIKQHVRSPLQPHRYIEPYLASVPLHQHVDHDQGTLVCRLQHSRTTDITSRFSDTGWEGGKESTRMRTAEHCPLTLQKVTCSLVPARYLAQLYGERGNRSCLRPR